MSTLKDKAQKILDEKNEKIISDNIKKDVQIFDIVGTLDDSAKNKHLDANSTIRYRLDYLADLIDNNTTEEEKEMALNIKGSEITGFMDISECAVSYVSNNYIMGKLYFSINDDILICGIIGKNGSFERNETISTIASFNTSCGIVPYPFKVIDFINLIRTYVPENPEVNCNLPVDIIDTSSIKLLGASGATKTISLSGESIIEVV